MFRNQTAELVIWFRNEGAFCRGVRYGHLSVSWGPIKGHPQISLLDFPSVSAQASLPFILSSSNNNNKIRSLVNLNSNRKTTSGVTMNLFSGNTCANYVLLPIEPGCWQTSLPRANRLYRPRALPFWSYISYITAWLY